MIIIYHLFYFSVLELWLIITLDKLRLRF